MQQAVGNSFEGVFQVSSAPTLTGQRSACLSIVSEEQSQ